MRHREMKHALQTKITGRGQTAIPVAVIKAIGAKPGNSLAWHIRDNGECVITVIDQLADDSAMSMLGFAKTFREPRKTSEWMDDLKGEL